MAVATREPIVPEAPDGSRPAAPRRRRRSARFSRADKLVLAAMMGVPTLMLVAFVWLPAIGSIVLSFSRWDGIGGFDTIQWIGPRNYREIFTIYPPFWPAVRHNLLWLAFFIVIPTTFGLFLAVLLDKEIRFSRVYQSVLYLPVLISLALIGFIWTLVYAPEQGLLNNLLGRTEPGQAIDWFGNPSINIWSVLVAASWRHVGYIMILYLAGLKSVDTTLREAAALDGANEFRAFVHVVFPALKPINIIVLVVTVIESLRAFDLVYVINKGTNGLELLSVLVTNNILGEASRIGYGSALAVILLLVSLGFIITYLVQVFRRELRS